MSNEINDTTGTESVKAKVEAFTEAKEEKTKVVEKREPKIKEVVMERIIIVDGKQITEAELQKLRENIPAGKKLVEVATDSFKLLNRFLG